VSFLCFGLGFWRVIGLEGGCRWEFVCLDACIRGTGIAGVLPQCNVSYYLSGRAFDHLSLLYHCLVLIAGILIRII
jgi:hypothetical protein